MNITQPKMLPAYAAQVVPAGTITITFTEENPYYPADVETEIPLYKMPIAGNSRVIQWGAGILPLSNLTARGAAVVSE